VNTPTLRARRGFTIIEMIVSMALMLSVIGMSTQLFRRQSTSVSQQTGVLDAQQNSRFAVSSLERELRVAGVGVADAQPLLVMANTLGITFNADLVAADTSDIGSVYINPDADSAAVDVFRKANALALPGTSKNYPDTTYMLSTNVPSNAETISYWLSKDSSVSYAYEYILWRRVNARPVRMVARGIRYDPTRDTIFHYFKSDSVGNLTEISPAALPVIHTAPIHGSPADTGKSALTDSIRQVRMSLISVFHDKRKPVTTDSTTRRLNLTIKLMNAGLIRHTTCGNPPIAPLAVTAAVTAANGTTIPQTYVTISWNAATDDNGTGEKDIERYAIYRRLSSASTFDQPIGSIVAGKATYSFQDSDLQSGQTWVYGVASLDCSPAASSITQASAVAIP
jgi:prepilin-type N-terminal cleavage/methylation domain-containing protein